MKVAHATGEEDVDIGTRFTDGLYGCSWEVVVERKRTAYSPCSLARTPVFGCKHIAGEMSSYWAVEADGLIDFCGDSIATAIERDRADGQGDAG